MLLREEPARLDGLQRATEQPLNRSRAVRNMQAGRLIVAVILKAGRACVEHHRVRLGLRVAAQRDQTPRGRGAVLAVADGESSDRIERVQLTMQPIAAVFGREQCLRVSEQREMERVVAEYLKLYKSIRRARKKLHTRET